MPTHEALLSQTFVQLADTLVDDFDVVDLLTVLVDRCTDLLDVGAAAVLLVDPNGALTVMAASSEQARLLELFQLQNQEGPCLDCCSTGTPVTNEDLERSNRWPRFGPQARAAGFVGVQALPLRLREAVIGALNIFMDDRVELSRDELALAQALADAATIAVIQHQAAQEAQLVATQLRTALHSRIAIEQAKGVLAERFQVDMGEAFARLRAHARTHNRRLSLVAGDLVNGALPFETFSTPAPDRDDRR